MPKIKTNRLAKKKFRVSGKGRAVKHGRAFTSHNTGKKRAKHGRRLRRTAVTDKTNVGAVRRQLPYLKHKGH